MRSTNSRREGRDRGRNGYRCPMAGLAGAPPPRGALAPRLVLAVFGPVACAAAAFPVLVNQPVIAEVPALLAAAAGIVVAARRAMRTDPGEGTP